jgi:hypothetical protein
MSPDIAIVLVESVLLLSSSETLVRTGVLDGTAHRHVATEPPPQNLVIAIF